MAEFHQLESTYDSEEVVVCSFKSDVRKEGILVTCDGSKSIESAPSQPSLYAYPKREKVEMTKMALIVWMIVYGNRNT